MIRRVVLGTGIIAVGVALASPDARAQDTAGGAQGADDTATQAPVDAVLPADEADDDVDTADAPESASPAQAGKAAGANATAKVDEEAAKVAASAPGGSRAEPTSLPTGADKSGVTSKTISVPKGAGTIKGMEESFSAQLSTGIATFSVPLSLPAARGGAQPSLGLSYSSSGGSGLAGMGWQIGVPFISRQTDRGVPHYGDTAGWDPEQDHFVFNGGQELVPICVVDGNGVCDGAIDDGIAPEVMPVWAKGWQYFRPRVEGSFLRFFWSSNHQTWRVQDKSGVTMELGVPWDGSNYMGALETNPDKPEEIFRWSLVRQYDTWGTANPSSGWATPNNVVVYRYFSDGNTAYISDIYDTPPITNTTTASLSSYAHHTHLVYEQRADSTVSYRSGWRMEQALRLVRVDVASATWEATGARRQVRRYHLSYDPLSHLSLLTSVQVEGRCSGAEAAAPAESNELLPAATSCPRLPAMTFEYGHVTPYTTSGGAGVADLPGFDGFDERIKTINQSPPHSVDEAQTDLFDVNSDGLPDVLVTAAGLYGAGHGVFFNGDGGTADRFGAVQNMGIQGVLGAGASTITLGNLNVAPLDLDGDATINLLHMPKVKTYAVYEPVFDGAKWWWKGRSIDTASGQSPKIDWGKDTLDTQVMDVNFDGLVDVVVTTGTEVQTFFSLGRYPGGDGQFGQAYWTGATTASISNEPVRTCVPWSATPVRFSDPDVKLADMNGDGITDIVRVRKGDIRYWPGRGNGFWGTGKRDDCPAGGFGSNRHVLMDASPQYSDVSGDSLRLDDVNGDGLTDLVQIRFSDVDVWLNVAGTSWTKRHIITGTPASPSYANRVRLADINGSGTRDILWGNANKYQYMDLAGGERPSVLTRVDNGLGKSTFLEYSTSTQEMLAADTAGTPWESRMPTVVHVVKRVTETDNHSVAGVGPGVYVTEYSYADPVFEGRQREFRGFKHASATRLGDANSPTDITDSTFLLGECVDEDAGDGIDACAVDQRWRDNPREALKGLPVITEKRDATGRYLSTELTAYRLRRVYKGLDGRDVRHAFEETKTSVLYDTDNFVPADQTFPLPLVQVELDPHVDGSTATVAGLEVMVNVTARSNNLAVIQSASTVDIYGNQRTATAFGCVQGCSSTDETIVTTTTPGRPTQDPTGWLWRTVSSNVEGQTYKNFQGKLKETDVTYNARGVPTTTTAHLHHTLALDRFHETAGAAVAATPADASQDGTITSSSSYDDFGNLTQESGPDGRCRGMGYDTTYGMLPVTEEAYRGGCGVSPLTTTADLYDRGLGLVTKVTNMQAQPTLIEYDAFGRLAATYAPDPDAVGASLMPSVQVEYLLPPDLGTPQAPAYHSIIHTRTQDGPSPSDDSFIESWSFVDGMGRTLVTLSEADVSAGDGGDWVVSGQVSFDAKGAVQRKCLDKFWTGTPQAFPFGAAPSSNCGEQTYDAFGRGKVTTDLDGTVTLWNVYHALSTDMWDAEDLGGHYGTYASETKDGHGRTARTDERFLDPGGSGNVYKRTTTTKYLPTGEPWTITRSADNTTETVKRWMRYDSLGRMVLNVEPNTSTGFTDNETVNPVPGTLKTWHYVYNDSGDLVGTSDARGCGENFAYDGVGRLKWEDYSPCRAYPYHLAYGAPNANGTSGAEVLYVYDAPPNLVTNDAPAGFFGTPYNTNWLMGRLVTVFDRGEISVSKYDGRGRVTHHEIRLSNPGSFASWIGNRYQPEWYEKTFAYDGADREVETTTGAAITELMGAADGQSRITTQYSHRGTVASAGGSYDTLVEKVERDADGLLMKVQYGDAADTATTNTYDDRRRLSTQVTTRSIPELWSSPPGNYQPPPAQGTALPTFQMLLQDDSFTYDAVGNPLSIADNRTASDWPDDAKPVDRAMEYDDFYRLKRIDYTYNGSNTWKSPFDAEIANGGAPTDPRHMRPMQQIQYDTRVGWQTFDYDWKGNTSETQDDQHGFYDRSLGPITNSTAKPYQLDSASNKTGQGTREGAVQTAYDEMGNLVRMHVERNGTCLGYGPCNHIFYYQWDEVGRLQKARRYDVTQANLGAPSDPLPTGAFQSEYTYTYNANDDRVLKMWSAGGARIWAYVFDTLELKKAAWIQVGDPPHATYDRTKWTEVPYLVVNGVRLARVHYHDSNPEIGGAETHVLFELGDHLGSTNMVLDQATGELVERSTYQAYGSRESDYRPDRWDFFREDYGFTGKEEDIDVGLTYFGKRYLSPYLNRWISPDPLAVHAFGADLNVYAYVNARVLAAVDPLGLEPASWWLASQATRRAILAEAAASGNPLAELVVGAGVLGFELGNAAGEHLYGDKIKAAEARAAEEKRRIAELKRQINATKQKLAAQRAKNRGLEAKLKASKTATKSRPEGAKRDGGTHRHDPLENEEDELPDPNAAPKIRPRPFERGTPSERVDSIKKAQEKKPKFIEHTDKTEQNERTNWAREHSGHDTPHDAGARKDAGGDGSSKDASDDK
ncbi:MAG: VCBS repeat-containing protein [Polyangiaceae bacterium]|nr:VCBS repeat-containing protein [Polyangiaceae bacterium]